jgi:hypothetical protein
LIIASDKTQLSTFNHNKSAWPVYLTIGNLPKALRRRVSLRTTILIGYLPVPSFDEILDDNTRREARHQVFHETMSILLHRISSIGAEGIELTCADSHVRRVYPVVASYVADFPEQCLIAGVQESRCPTCITPTDGRGDLSNPPPQLRDVSSALQAHAYRRRHGFATHDFINLGLRPIWPFWAKLPHTSIYSCFTPDVLHQLHRGLFKDHLFAWLADALGRAELDRRYRAMPLDPSIQHFHRRVTNTHQTTGREHREMEKVFLVALSGAKGKMLKAAQSLLTFIYLSHYSSFTTETLRAMDSALDSFHRAKEVFKDSVKNRKGFDGIPKLHAISHYTSSIRRLGAPDGFSTETPERYHIDYAKDPYRASNRVNPTKQMTTRLQRDEAVRIWTAYLSWSTGFTFSDCYTAPEAEADPQEATHDLDGTDQWNQHPSTMLIRHHLSTYPNPTVLIAQRPPYKHRLPGWLISQLGATDIIPCVNTFLRERLPPSHHHLELSPRNDGLSVWTRLRLVHKGTRFAAVDQDVVEVIQARPPQRDTGGRATSPGLFSTVLVLENPTASGILRESFTVSWVHVPLTAHAGYRAARVRAVFTLPPRFGDLSTTKLAYIEYFTPFAPTLPRNPQQLYTLSPSKRTNGRRVASVVPLDRIKLVCHLAPNFHPSHMTEQLWDSEDILQDGSSFYLNEYSSHLFYSFMYLWKMST